LKERIVHAMSCSMICLSGEMRLHPVAAQRGISSHECEVFRAYTVPVGSRMTTCVPPSDGDLNPRTEVVQDPGELPFAVYGHLTD
jgi:hypothetical protein